MSEPFEERVRGSFRRLEEKRGDSLARTAGNLARQEDAADRWPGLRGLMRQEVLPRLTTWTREVAEVIQPAQVKQLQRERRRVSRMSAVTWWHPRGLYIRLRLAFYLSAILVMVLFWTSLVIGFVVTFFWALFQLLDLIQSSLG